MILKPILDKAVYTTIEKARGAGLHQSEIVQSLLQYDSDLVIETIKKLLESGSIYIKNFNDDKADLVYVDKMWQLTKMPDFAAVNNPPTMVTFDMKEIDERENRLSTHLEKAARQNYDEQIRVNVTVEQLNGSIDDLIYKNPNFEFQGYSERYLYYIVYDSPSLGYGIVSMSLKPRF